MTSLSLDKLYDCLDINLVMNGREGFELQVSQTWQCAFHRKAEWTSFLKFCKYRKPWIAWLFLATGFSDLWIFSLFAFLSQPVGCDHELGSKAVSDACGVCKGDNSTCKFYKGLYLNQHKANGKGRCCSVAVPGGTHLLLLNKFKWC